MKYWVQDVRQICGWLLHYWGEREDIERNGFINHYVWSAPKTLKKYSPATLDTVRNMSEKVGYFVQL